MPDPTPTPDPTPRKWWEDFLPTNWKKLVAWVVVGSLIQLINWMRGPNATPIPLPDLPDFELVIGDETKIEPAAIEELHKRKVKVRHTGWREPREQEKQATLRVLQVARFGDTEAGQEIIADSDAPLFRLAYKGRNKPIPIRDQGQIGSCVSFGFAGAVEYTMAAQVALSKERQDLPDMCQEAIYAGSRVEVNGGRVPFNGDGSTGAWGAKWLESTGGALARGKYGSIDLTAYDVSRCKQWGNKGVPDELEPECRKHAAKCTLVSSGEEARKALSQGYAIAVCSNQGFSNVRDSEGFAKAQGSWGHCMLIAGYRADKPGFLIVNSWGPNWITGPKGKFDDIPDGSFWAEASVVDRMLKQQDSFAVANAVGFKKRKITPDDWTVRNETPARRRFPDAIFALSP